MNYPIWEVTTWGGGSLIALIAVLHVYIAHLAVGGGLFLWLTDWKGFREGNSDIHDYVRKHTWFFLLLTMVFGGVSGVGIWFIIALVSPAATSSLIHNFVFGWAIEWVFFVGEIVALLIYHYKFSRLGRKVRLRIAFFYFLFAWLSLAVIDGILSFMLTPGDWLETRSFWDGFLNPTYLSSLVFRTFMCMMVAGLFGYLTTVFLKVERFRHTMMKYNSRWLLWPLPAFVLSGIWYYYSVPAAMRATAFGLNPQSGIFLSVTVAATVVLFVLGIVVSLKAPLAIQRGLAFLVVVIGLLWMGGFEYTREIARKPWVIGGYMYSNAILAEEMEGLNETGVLPAARWAGVKAVTAENSLVAGKELFNLQCLSCHTVDGVRNDIAPLLEDYTYLGALSLLTGQGKIQDYMPPIAGTGAEVEALAAYLAAGIMEKEITTDTPRATIAPVTQEVPAFDGESDDYMLLVWNDLGMHCISDSDPWFVILPPANTLEAQLIRRDSFPSLVTEGVTLTYEVEAGFENPADEIEFWKYAKSNFGADLPENVGLFGNGLAGEFKYDEKSQAFVAEGIPVAPYKSDGTFNPYPTFTVRATDDDGTVLMETTVVTPVSTEMGCRNCHEGGWRTDSGAGIDAVTAQNLLEVHDRFNGTTLLAGALDGAPRLCQSCHADPALGAQGDDAVLNFSAAMHGWHANYMPYNDARACALCHPASKTGSTRCSRGIHNTLGLTCTDCHGTFQEHALSLLRNEEAKPAARRLMSNLSPTSVSDASEVNPRTPWVNEPDCMTCHTDYEKPESGVSGFNVWNSDFYQLYRKRTDEVGVRCEACHGSTHALYPSNNPYSADRDNLQPLQYGGLPYAIGSNLTCAVCHREEMEDAVHHENIEHMFRNAENVQQ